MSQKKKNVEGGRSANGKPERFFVRKNPSTVLGEMWDVVERHEKGDRVRISCGGPNARRRAEVEASLSNIAYAAKGGVA